MNVKSVDSKIIKKKNKLLDEHVMKDIGSFIKKQRVERNITQEKLSEGICSISYLSKIENNQIIPNHYLCKKIFERLEVKEDCFNVSIKDHEYLKEAINAYFYYQNDLLSDIYDEVQVIEKSIKKELIELIYFLVFDKQKAKKYINLLENIVKTMRTEELSVYLLFSSVYYLSINKNRLSFQILNSLENVDVRNKKVILLMHYYRYIVSQKLKLKNYSHNDYNEYLSLSVKYNNNIRLNNLKLVKSEFLLLEDPVNAFNSLKYMSPRHMTLSQKNKLYYLLGACMYRLKLFDEALNELENVYENSKYYAVSLLVKLAIYKRLNDTYNHTITENLIKNLVANDRLIKERVNFQYKIIEDECDKKDYLREIAIPYSIKTEDYYMLEYYVKAIMDICIKNSRYKEALQYLKKLNKENGRKINKERVVV